MGQIHPRVADSDLDSLRWFLSIRGKVSVALLFVLFLVTQVEGMPVQTAVHLMWINVVLLVVNAAYYLALKGNPPVSTLRFLRQLLMPVDVILSTVAVYVSGGVLTPLAIVYPLNILTSIVLLDPRGVYRTAIYAVSSYLVLTLLEAYNLIPYIEGYWGPGFSHADATFVTYALYLLAVSAIIMAAAFIGNRIALLLNQRNAQIVSRLRDLRTLYDITDGLGNIMEEDRVLNYLATTLMNLQDATACLVLLVSKEGRFEVKAAAGVDEGSLEKLRELRAETPELTHLLQSAEPLIIEDFDYYPHLRIFRLNPTTRSVYVFPIKVEAHVLGVISLSFDKVRPLSPEQRDLLTAVAAQAGVALQRTQLLSDARLWAMEMSILHDVGLHTGSTLSADEVIRRTSDSIEKLLSPDAYYIALHDAEGATLTFEVFVESGQPLPRMQVPVHEGGLAGRIIQSCEPLLVQDRRSGDSLYTPAKFGADMLSYLGVPVVSDGEVVAVISVQSTRAMAFTHHHERLLVALAAQTAMALENARLHRQAQDQGRLDSMTQVYNHGCFIEQVRQAVAFASNDGSPVSLIMLDVDHFKRYNDSYGHVAGDNVLKMVAAAMKENIKATDAVGRWGGEEFGVLLPGADLKDAMKVARRIRRSIAKIAPTDGQGRVIPAPTVSQGVSCYPDPSPSTSSLIEKADAALYHAKENGRNQLIITESIDQMREVHITAPLSK
jgi:diguanylate cyclase (GGDEF)-like protein